MNKRQLLAAGMVGAALPWPTHAAPSRARTGPGLLTVAGAIPRGNRGPLDVCCLAGEHTRWIDRAEPTQGAPR